MPANNSQLSNSRMIDSSLFQPQQQSGLAIGACSEQGRRPYQEDEFVVSTFSCVVELFLMLLNGSRYERI